MDFRLILFDWLAQRCFQNRRAVCIAFTMMLSDRTLSLLGVYRFTRDHSQQLFKQSVAFYWVQGNWVSSSLPQEVQNVHFAAGGLSRPASKWCQDYNHRF